MKSKLKLALVGTFLFMASAAVVHAGDFQNSSVSPGQSFKYLISEVMVSTSVNASTPTPTLIMSSDTLRYDTYIINTSTWSSVQIIIATSIVTCTTGTYTAASVQQSVGPSAFILDVATSTVTGFWGGPASMYKDDNALQYVGPWYALAVGTSTLTANPGKVKVSRQRP